MHRDYRIPGFFYKHQDCGILRANGKLLLQEMINLFQICIGEIHMNRIK